MQSTILKIHPKDNVLVALADLRKGEFVETDGCRMTLVTDVPAKHKFVLQPLRAGDPVIMYGVLVGKAAASIRAGEVVTTANLCHTAAPVQRRSQVQEWKAPDVGRW